MTEALTVFAGGIAVVFLGMALLYVAIRVTSFVVDRLAAGETPDE